MTKFKVGDLVKAKRSADSQYSITNTKMLKGAVIDIYENGKMLQVEVLSHKSSKFKGSVGDAFEVCSKYFTKITPKPKIKGLAGKKAVPKTLKGKKMKLVKKYYISDIEGRGFTGNFNHLNQPRFREFHPIGVTLVFDDKAAVEDYVLSHEQFLNYYFFIDSFCQAVSD